MTTLRSSFLTCAAATWLVVSVGCKATVESDSEADTLLRAVSYDTTFPPIPPSLPAAREDATPPASSAVSSGETASSGRWIVWDGLKLIGFATVFVAFKVVEAYLDDDDDDFGGDRELNQWRRQRDRWERDDRARQKAQFSQ